VAAEHLVGDGGVVLGNAEQVLLGVLDGLLDGERHLTGLAVTDTDDLGHVTHDHERGEGEAPSTLDDLRDAIDLHHPLGELEPAGVDALSTYVRQLDPFSG